MLLIWLLKKLGVNVPDSIGKVRPGVANFAIYSMAALVLFIAAVFIMHW